MSETYTNIQLEDWVQGPLHLVDSEAARANKRAIETHFEAEWNGDLDATMRTIHPDGPWQIVHGLGVDVHGAAAVREYYSRRFESWPGPAMEHFTRVTVTDTCVYFEGRLTLEPQGDFGGHPAKGAHVDVPAVIVVDCRDGLVLGETVHLDSAAVQAQLGNMGNG